jgi:NAD(P)H-dependent flavin oxidoreductase YrpB (nitropropane dioxygenase family)
METTSTFPKIIQGGMGVNISSWPLARTVSMLGQQGTVSGTVLEKVMARILQSGDPGGHFRRALSHFPFPHITKKVLATFYVEGGISKGVRFRGAPVFRVTPSNLLIALAICANYAFVWLAKEGHKNPVSINYLEKVAMPHIYAITGAMLAGADFITMGAGIPLQIPGVINDIAEGKTASYRVPVIGKSITSYTMTFNLEQFFEGKLPPIKRPGFIPIIASNPLASVLKKKLPEGSVYGFVIEEPTAGGHNASPRKPILNARGEPEPIYGEKDVVDYSEIAKFGLPFWIGGSKASPEKLKWALSVGAKGIQAGSIFALCEESGMNPEIRKKIRELGFSGKLRVRTDMRISPTGFPFKVATLDGTISEQSVYEARVRVCNQGALVSLYERGNESIGYRCAGEPVDKFVSKGGNAEDTVGRGCLCNGLLSAAGLGNEGEAPIVTLGDDVGFLSAVMADSSGSYSAKDAITYLLGHI